MSAACPESSPSPVDAGAAREDVGSPPATGDADLPDSFPSDAETLDRAVDRDAEPLDVFAEDARVEPIDAGTVDADPLDADERDATSMPDGNAVGFEIEGFGRDTVGGAQVGRIDVSVTSLLDDGPGTLRDALRTNDLPTVVRFDVEGTIALGSALLVPSNVTIDGRGRDVTLHGKGLVIAGRDQVIVTGLTIEDVGPTTEDGVQIGALEGVPSTRVVIDHVHFRATASHGSADEMDEGISVVWGSNQVTIQWCRFENIEKVMLFGNGDADASIDRNITVTVHHNWFDRTGRRHPRARFGKFDVYDNYYDHWHRFSDAAIELRGRRTHGAWCHDGCEMIMEANVFARDPHPNDDGIGVQWPNQASRCAPDPLNAATSGEFAGTIENRGGWVTPESTSVLEFGVGCPPSASALVFARPYPATIDPTDEALRQRLITEAGDR